MAKATAKAIEKGLSQNTLSLECQLFLNFEEDRRREAYRDTFLQELLPLKNLKTTNQMLSLSSHNRYTSWGWQKSLSHTHRLLSGSAQYGNFEILKLLVASEPWTQLGFSEPIRQACCGGHLEILQYLIEATNDPKMAVVRGEIAIWDHFGSFLREARSCGQREIVEYLESLI